MRRYQPGLPADATISNCGVGDNARSGVAAFDAIVRLAGSKLSCNGFDLTLEDLGFNSVAIEDGGGNACGCDAEQTECRAISAGLRPPEALDQDE